jgi:hypothetical protein
MKKAMKDLIGKARRMVEVWRSTPLSYEAMPIGSAVDELEEALEPFESIDLGADWYLKYSDAKKECDEYRETLERFGELFLADDVSQEDCHWVIWPVAQAMKDGKAPTEIKEYLEGKAAKEAFS